VQFAVTVVIIAVIKAVFSTGNRPSRQTTDYAPPYNQPSQNYRAPETPAVQPMPKTRQHLTLDQIVALHGEALKRRPDLGMSVQEFSRYMQANRSDYDFSEGIAYSPPPTMQSEPLPTRVTPLPPLEKPASARTAESASNGAAGSSKASEASPKSVEMALKKAGDSIPPMQATSTKEFFTVGSTKEDVLAIHGEPTRFSDTYFQYGRSMVWFDGGRVSNWTIDDIKLKARYWTTIGAQPKEYFTVGSTKEDVLAIHGEPTRFSDTYLQYGRSMVWFDGGRVSNWTVDDVKLKGRYWTATGVQPKEYFTVGSRREDVLAIHGEPTRFSDTYLQYGRSMVWFDGGRVSNWTVDDVKLKARYWTTPGAQPKEYFTVGSTREDVLAIHGEPTRFSDTYLQYGRSMVWFDGGRVSNWTVDDVKLKARLPGSQISTRP
jgi:type IV secretory pathway protease TraF